MTSTPLKSLLLDLSLSGNSLREKCAASGVPEQQVNALLENTFNVSVEDITGYSIGPELTRLIPYTAALHYTVAPLKIENQKLFVALIDPTDLDLIEDLRFLTNHAIQPVLSSRTLIQKVTEQAYTRADRSKTGEAFTLHEDTQPVAAQKAQGSPAVTLINGLITQAVSQGASDIHFEPVETGLKIRFRLDGVLQETAFVPTQRRPEVISRLKIMASLDIAEKRRPQDGRIRIAGEGRTIDIRVSTFPTAFGEKVVLRILDKTQTRLNLTDLGFDAGRLDLFHKALKRPNGMILVTGPTGSGKTTTLYAGLNQIKHPGINISTIEDPIEYHLDGVNQSQVKSDIGYTFAAALRTLLRQDPNVIMVGEIRDRETAEIAIRAALTGHLVLSTLHTNDAPSAVTRLLDMGIEPYLIASSLHLVIAQRLVRRVCGHCKTEIAVKHEDLLELGLLNESPHFFQGKGCPQCNQTGYRGRIALLEALPLDESLRELVNAKRSALDLRQEALKRGLVTLRHDGIAKLKAGITSFAEVLRETTLS